MPNDIDYKVLVNQQGQYSIWPETKEVPTGWREAGHSGSKQEVLEWVKSNWTDMRPISLRE